MDDSLFILRMKSLRPARRSRRQSTARRPVNPEKILRVFYGPDPQR
jgi:hypothetical protein